MKTQQAMVPKATHPYTRRGLNEERSKVLKTIVLQASGWKKTKDMELSLE